MKIFKSRIEIFKRGELTPKVFEMVVDHGEILEDEERFRMMTLGNEIKFYALDNEGKSVECSIEDYQKEPYYEFLKKKEYEYVSYLPNLDGQYVVDIFERNNAQDYLDFDNYCEQTSCEYKQLPGSDEIDTIVYKYELDVETLKRKFLEIKELVDLTDEELDKVLCRLLERKILKEAPFIKSIKVKRELNGNQEYYEVIRINGKKCEEFYLKGANSTTMRSDVAIGMPLIYFKGRNEVDEFSSNPMRFYEDENDNEILVFVGRRKYGEKEVAQVFESGFYDSYKKTMVCITSKTNIEHML